MENLDIIIPFYQGHEFIERLLESLPAGLNITIVDDQSPIPLELNPRFSHVRVLKNPTRGYFSGAVNYGIRSTTGNVLVLNQDVWFNGVQWLEKIEKLDKDIAIYGDGVFGHPAWPKGYVQGTFMFMRRAALNQAGYLNAELYPLWGATAEWQLRATRYGWKAKPARRITGMMHEDRRGKPYGQAIVSAIQEKPDLKSLFIRTPPLVSVLIPVYNQGIFLPETIASLIGGNSKLGERQPQTFQSFEIIIVDDASTDDTAKIADQLADPFQAIRVIHHAENRGTAAALNTAAKEAFGKYLTVLGADDMRAERSLELMVKAQDENPHSLIYDDVVMFEQIKPERKNHLKTGAYDFEKLLERNFIHAGIMIPKKAWEEVGGWPEEMRYGREDWAMNIRLGIAGWCGVHVDYAGYLYRRHSDNRTIHNTTGSWRTRFAEQIHNLYPKIFEGERPMGCCGQRKSSLNPNGGAGINGPHPTITQPGQTVLRYMGGNYGNQSLYGPITGKRYTYSKGHPLISVDNSDLRTDRQTGLLDLSEGRSQMFVVNTVT